MIAQMRGKTRSQDSGNRDKSTKAKGPRKGDRATEEWVRVDTGDCKRNTHDKDKRRAMGEIGNKPSQFVTSCIIESVKSPPGTTSLTGIRGSARTIIEKWASSMTTPGERRDSCCHNGRKC
jgi:hypothetical protein